MVPGMLQHYINRTRSISQANSSGWPRSKLLQVDQHMPFPPPRCTHTYSPPTTTPSTTLRSQKFLQGFTHTCPYLTLQHVGGECQNFNPHPPQTFLIFGTSCSVQVPLNHPMSLMLTQSIPRPLAVPEQGASKPSPMPQGARTNQKSQL